MDDFFTFATKLFGTINYSAFGIVSRIDVFNTSLVVFGACFLLGLLVCALSAAGVLRRGAAFALFTLFELFFFADLALCYSECKFFGERFADFSEAYVFCFCQFAVLLATALIARFCAALSAAADLKRAKRLRKALLKKEETDRLIMRQFPPKARLSESVCDKDGKIRSDEDLKSEAIERFLGGKNQTKKYVDVNAAYIRKVIDLLKSKDLSDEDRENVTDLEIMLNRKIEYDGACVSRLNELLRRLLKMTAKYDAVVE